MSAVGLCHWSNGCWQDCRYRHDGASGSNSSPCTRLQAAQAAGSSSSASKAEREISSSITRFERSRSSCRHGRRCKSFVGDTCDRLWFGKSQGGFSGGGKSGAQRVRWQGDVVVEGERADVNQKDALLSGTDIVTSAAATWKRSTPASSCAKRGRLKQQQQQLGSHCSSLAGLSVRRRTTAASGHVQACKTASSDSMIDGLQTARGDDEEVEERMGDLAGDSVEDGLVVPSLAGVTISPRGTSADQSALSRTDGSDLSQGNAGDENSRRSDCIVGVVGPDHAGDSSTREVVSGLLSSSQVSPDSVSTGESRPTKLLQQEQQQEEEEEEVDARQGREVDDEVVGISKGGDAGAAREGSVAGAQTGRGGVGGSREAKTTTLGHSGRKLIAHLLRMKVADRTAVKDMLDDWCAKECEIHKFKQQFPQELVSLVALELRRKQRWGHLALLLDWTTCHPRYKPILLHYNLLILAYGKLGHIRRVAATFKALGQTCLQPSVVTFSSLLSAFGKKGLQQHAVQLFHKMKEMGLKPNIQVYGALLDAFCKAGEPDRALRAFREMQASGIVPNINVYNIVINAFTKQGRMHEAENLLKECMAAELDPDIVTFSTLIRGYAKVNQIQNVEQIYTMMKGRGWIPGTEPWKQIRKCKVDVKLCTMMIDAFGKAGLVDEAEAVLGQMMAVGISPDIVAYTSLVDAYARAKMFNEARSVISEMEDRVRSGEAMGGLQLDSRVYTPLISAYAREGMWEDAEELVTEMRSNGPKPGTFVCNALMNAYSKAGMVDKAEALLEEMKASGVDRTTITFTSLMEAYGEIGDAVKVEGVLRLMGESGVSIDRTTYAVLINASVKCNEIAKAERAFRQMQNDGHRVQVTTYNVMIGAYAKVLRVADAEALFRSMVASRTPPDVITYNLLLRMYIRSGSRGKMENLYKQMQMQGVKPNAETYEMIRQAYAKAGNYTDADRVALDMRRSSSSVDLIFDD